MAEAVNFENVDIAAIMENEAFKEVEEKLTEKMEENPVVTKLMEAAQTVEDAYQVVKEYVTVKLEDFKVLFDRTVNYFRESKTALSDEVMEAVVGGGWFSDFWNNHKKQIIRACVIIGAGVVGAAVGVLTGGAAGAFALGVLGLAGGALGISIYESSQKG